MFDPTLPFVKNWSKHFNITGSDQQNCPFSGLVMLLAKMLCTVQRAKCHLLGIS